MKQFCDSLMKLNSNLPYGTDYSPVILGLFICEEGIEKTKVYDVFMFATYVYRFYIDNKFKRKNHYYKLINEIDHYQPSDIYEYTKAVLKHVENATNLISFLGDSFCLNDLPDEINMPMVKMVVATLVKKYIGAEFCDYSSKISQLEYGDGNIFSCGTRVYNRALELCNYCFICDETLSNNLCAVKLSETKEYVEYNHLVLCLEHANQYVKKDMRIMKNGYPFVNGERMLQHIEIGILKKIRPFLMKEL